MDELTPKLPWSETTGHRTGHAVVAVGKGLCKRDTGEMGYVVLG